MNVRAFHLPNLSSAFKLEEMPLLAAETLLEWLRDGHWPIIGTVIAVTWRTNHMILQKGNYRRKVRNGDCGIMTPQNNLASKVISSQLSLKSMSSSGSLRLDICTPRYFLLFLSFHLLAIDGCLSVQHSLSSCLEAFSISLQPATPWRYRNFRWILTHLSTDHAHPSLSFTGGEGGPNTFPLR